MSPAIPMLLLTGLAIVLELIFGVRVLPALLGLLAVFAAVWLISLAVQDSSIVDMLWGPAFVFLAVIVAPWGRLDDGHVWLLVLLSIWAFRLSWHIALRHKGEDQRYTDMRGQDEDQWWWRSGVQVFGLQAVLVVAIAAPLLACFSERDGNGLLQALGVVLWAAGFAWEAVADYQLAQFRQARTSSQEIMDQGLWGLSRHPNYFGEILLWWGYGLFGLSVGALWSLVGPLLMSWLLVKVSGVALMESHMAERPGYADYRERVPALVPRFWT